MQDAGRGRTLSIVNATTQLDYGSWFTCGVTPLWCPHLRTTNGGLGTILETIFLQRGWGVGTELVLERRMMVSADDITESQRDTATGLR